VQGGVSRQKGGGGAVKRAVEGEIRLPSCHHSNSWRKHRQKNPQDADGRQHREIRDGAPKPPANNPRFFHGQDIMAVDGANSSPALDRHELRQALVTSSTKRRITELSSLPDQVSDASQLLLSFTVSK
jgi:hypothetical protein